MKTAGKMKWIFAAVVMCAAAASAADASDPNRPASDIITTDAGNLKITFIGHGTLMFECAGKTIHVDPWTKLADYTKLPKADAVLVTHSHRDHLDVKAIDAIRKAGTQIIVAADCTDKVAGGIVLKNGEKGTAAGFAVEAVPAYNITGKRPNGQPFHAKGDCNGYVITFGKTRVYVAGDTENTPEMKALKNIDIAFLPMNQPYTMTPPMVADAAKAFLPKILYPYHYGMTDNKTDLQSLIDLLKDNTDIDVRIRRMD